MTGIAKTVHKGFTIIELLIVIVVIGILAAITITAYRGIQQRASNTQTIQAVSQYYRALQSYAVLNNSYPDFGGSSCLGIGYADRDGDGQADCGGTDYPALENPDFNNKMLEIIGSLPIVNKNTISVDGGVSYTGAIIVRWSDFMVNGVSSPYYLMYVLSGANQDCRNDRVVDIDSSYPNMKHPASNKYSWSGGSWTMCVVSLPNV